MSTYSTSAVTSNPTEDTIQAALQILTTNGFAICSRDESSASLTGPGLNSTSQNPLLGATAIRLALEGNQLKLDAELGGAKRMQRFIKSVPWACGLGTALLLCVLGVQFGWLFGAGFGVPGLSGWNWLLLSLGAGIIIALPWMILSPWMSRMILSKTEQALKTLVLNATQLSKAA